MQRAILREAGLKAEVVEELAQVPENQELHAFLGQGVCRSRYNVPDLDSAIAPLLRIPPRGLVPQMRPFRDDELRAFALPPGPASSPLLRNSISNDEEERSARAELNLKSTKKRPLSQDGDGQGDAKKRR